MTFLPDSFADLAILSNLDLSHNQLASLPDNFWALPNLCVLNLSHNSLTSLPFNAPFAECTNPLARTSDPRGDWYSETITRATNSLPKLTSLDVSHNIISSSSIDHQDWTQLPSLINKLDLSFNPLGDCVSLLRALSKLRNLQELRCEHAEIGDESFPVSLFDAVKDSSHSTTSLFSHLTVLDLGETQVTKPVIEAVFLPPFIKQTIEFEVTADPPKEGTLRVITGKRIVKEAWEVEAERRARLKVERHAAAVNAPQEFSSLDGFRSTSPSKGRAKKEVDKEGWEIEAERGLTSAGAKRRARTAAGFADGPSSSSTRSVTTPPSSTTRTALAKKAQAEKERWEIEAEQGLLTEGGRRRARAAAAMAAVLSSGTPSERSTRSPPSTRSQTSTPATSPSPSNSNSSLLVLSNPKYYSSETRTLTLPPSVAPVAKGGYPHGRSFSLAGSSSSTNIGQPASGHRHAAAAGGNSELALAVPTPTLPLHAILTQAFSHTLTTLVLKNRRMDPSIALPCDSEAPFLPCLEELCLEGCNLMENVVVARVQEMSGSGSTGDLAGAGNGEGGRGKTSEKLLDVIPKLFPSLRSLDLSYNALGSSAFTKDVLSSLILSKPSSDSGSTAKKGLRQLRLRGNKLTDLNGFQDFAMGFKGFREVKEWRLEELDLRDNEIGRLPPEVGLLPLEVFLVDGNL